GMVVGVIIGLNFTGLVPYLEPVGEIYLSILMMCVIPILASAIMTSIGKLVNSEGATSRYIAKLITVFVIFLLGVSVISVISGGVSRYIMEVDIETQRAIGEVTLTGQSATNTPVPGTAIREINSQKHEAENVDEYSVVSFLVNIIPENIFTALSNNNNLQVIFFFTLFGVMLKYISDQATTTIISFFEGTFMAFQKLIRVTMYFLPFGLAALVATQLSEVGFTVLISLLQFIVLVYIVALIIFLVSTIIIWKQGNKSYLNQFKVMGETLMICLGTRNSFAAIPSSISGLSKGLGLDQHKINLSVPLGVSICRFGNVMVFSLGALFAVQLYGHDLGYEKLLIIVITSVLAGMATSGAPGLVARTMIAMVLVPLGIPATAIIAMLLAIDPIIDPITTVINVYPNLAAAAMISNKDSKAEVRETFITSANSSR
ncbi:MAG: dicarboxylate/amino acid:cation symporter, partial [Halanaerobiaceae bacterium]